MILETTANQSNIQRREQLKQAMLTWLARQPNRRALETEFRNRVGRTSDYHALLADQVFAVYEYKGKKWITAQTLQGAASEVSTSVVAELEADARRQESAQLKKQRRAQMRQDVLLWLTS